jgi:hypothetical protein
MFEFIGFVVVVWVAWKTFKVIANHKVQGTLSRAIAYAEAQGIPHQFCSEVVEYPELVKQARQELAAGNRDFAAQDVFQQYGQALELLYARGLQAEMRRLKKHFDEVFGPQRDWLTAYSACYIAGLYVCAVTASIARMTPNAEDLKEIFDHCFRHKELEWTKDMAWHRMMNSPEAAGDLAAFSKLVGREIETKKFDFIPKLRQKYVDIRLSGMLEGELAAADPHWFLKL